MHRALWRHSLENQFGRDWAQTTGIAADGLVRFAMAALLEYLHDTQIKGVERLKTVITYNEGPVHASFARNPRQSGADRDAARPRKAGHAALGAG